MLIFKKKDQDIYIVTNFKVMSSTLKNQKNVVRVGLNKRLYLKFLLSWISPKSKFYLIVRNPFNRIKSFYKDKFLNAEGVRLWKLKNNEEQKWQSCTEHFFPYLNLSTDMDPMTISKALSTTSFNKVISVLPNVYQKDGHMKPQYLAKKISFLKYGIRFHIPIRFEKVFKIENSEHLSEIENIFCVNLSKSLNSTHSIPDKIIYDEPILKIITTIYKKDFEEFNYEKTT